jgi:uncharacterized protein (DUF1501 family)
MTTPLSRRQFLQSGAAMALGMGVASPVKARSTSPRADAVILLNLVGGPSQLDTWDPKPAAKSLVRGPFQPISTSVPGLQISELFPRMASMAQRFNLLRGMHHESPPIHELGLQLLNAGKAFGAGPELPSLGAVAARVLDERDLVTPWWHLSDGPIDTGLRTSAGQGWGSLTRSDDVRVDISQPYGFKTLVDCALKAVETGARFVSVNMFSSVFDQPSWDCHADMGALSCDLDDYRQTVAPSFDSVFCDLLTRLEESGRLQRTLVVASGEFGRTPLLNSNGGRDHWAKAWTAIVAGGGTGGGKVIGSTDALGAEPKERPISTQELHATMGYALGLPQNVQFPGTSETVFNANPISELWR